MSTQKTGFTGARRDTERVTIRFDTVIHQQIQAEVEAGNYPNYSEAVRQLVLRGLQQGENSTPVDFIGDGSKRDEVAGHNVSNENVGEEKR